MGARVPQFQLQGEIVIAARNKQQTRHHAEAVSKQTMICKLLIICQIVSDLRQIGVHWRHQRSIADFKYSAILPESRTAERDCVV
ncbi:MAG: hypothetical protein MI924_39205 [Chloroflexales bacterium]|nr:hypothetical protein [Chloroflexales bacterium]